MLKKEGVGGGGGKGPGRREKQHCALWPRSLEADNTCIYYLCWKQVMETSVLRTLLKWPSLAVSAEAGAFYTATRSLSSISLKCRTEYCYTYETVQDTCHTQTEDG